MLSLKFCYYDSGDGTNLIEDPTATCSPSTTQDIGTYCDNGEGSGVRYVCRNPMPGMGRGTYTCSNSMRRRNGMSRDPGEPHQLILVGFSIDAVLILFSHLPWD